MSDRFRVRVPATTSNLGPGFDALGLALDIENTVIAERASQLEIQITGEGAAELPRDATNMLVQSLVRGCAAAKCAVPTLRLTCTHAIPPARGLGSSASAVIAGLLLADAFSAGSLGRDGVLALATEIEGHPDNAAPAVFGGLQVAVLDAKQAVHRVTVPVPVFPTVALFIPDFPMATHAARAVLPTSLTRQDTVFNLSRTALLVAGLAAGRFDVLAVATEDALHQRPRSTIFPALPGLIAAALAAGAHGAFLSGAGSTVAAFAPEKKAGAIADAMALCARELGLSGRAMVTRVATSGASCEAA